jgi:hypothetical protein
MAEIKSTIDLIMERTKNLSASPEEREAYLRQQQGKHITGLVQRLLDYSLTLDDIQDELEQEKNKTSAAAVSDFLKKDLAGHVDPEADNERLFRIISELTGTPDDRLRETLLICREEFSSSKTGVMESQMKVLESKGVAGSAVLPNPEADLQWKSHREEMLASCARRILGAIGG